MFTQWSILGKGYETYRIQGLANLYKFWGQNFLEIILEKCYFLKKQKACRCIGTSAFPFIMISIIIRLTSFCYLLSMEGGLNLVCRQISTGDTGVLIISLWYQYYPMFTLGQNLIGQFWNFAKYKVLWCNVIDQNFFSVPAALQNIFFFPLQINYALLEAQ